MIPPSKSQSTPVYLKKSIRKVIDADRPLESRLPKGSVNAFVFDMGDSRIPNFSIAFSKQSSDRSHGRLAMVPKTMIGLQKLFMADHFT